jgi:hypothetical protein
VPDHPQHADLDSLLDALGTSDIEFIVVGGAAAVLHGAPITTQEVDIVHKIDEENVRKLKTLLDELDVRIRDAAGRSMPLEASALLGTGHVRLSTSRGPLDLLCRLHDGRGFDELIPHTETVTDGSVTLRIVDLPTLIEIKSNTGTARDQLMVPVLLARARERES